MPGSQGVRSGRRGSGFGADDGNVLQRKPRCRGAGGPCDRVKREGYRPRSTRAQQRARPVRASHGPPDTWLRQDTRAYQPAPRRPVRRRPRHHCQMAARATSSAPPFQMTARATASEPPLPTASPYDVVRATIVK